MRKWKLAIVTVASACILGGALLVSAGGPPADAKYVGANKCMACHMQLHKAWKETKHAKVYEQLQGDEVKNPECIKCHSTGYGKPSGFTDIEKTPNLKGVTCEACHGPASAHIEAALNKPDTGDWDTKINKVPQNVCINCHNPHIDRKALAEKARAEKK